MASMFRPTVIRYVDKAGKRCSKDSTGAKRIRVKSKTWRGRYTDANGKTKSVTLFDDKDLSKAKFATIQQRVREELAGVRKPDPFEVHRETPLLCPRCNGGGCLDAKGQKTIDCDRCHVDDWAKTLRSRQRSEKHVFKLTSYLSRIIDACEWQTLNDLSADDLEHYHCERRQQGMSISASNDYVAAAKNFGSWLIKSRPMRWHENPFVGIGKLNADEDVRLERRPATMDELRSLLTATENAKPFRGLTGRDRSVLYRVAVETGFRANELASLTSKSLDLDSELPTITVEAGYSKRRRRDVQPIRAEVADALREWLRTREQPILKLDGSDDSKLWPGTWPERAAKMLRGDLKNAGLKAETEDGTLDFHCLRRTFATNLARAGVSPKAAQELMRHSDINLTMSTYTNLMLRDVASDLDKLPSLSPSEVLRTTATASAGVLVAPMVALEPVQPKSSQELSVHVNDLEGRLETQTKNPRKLSPCEGLFDVMITSDQGPSLGLEPRTYALRKRRSTD